jgi:putative sterol carrier protein
MTVTITELMSLLPGAFLPEKAAGMDAVVHFKLTGTEAGEWNAVIRNGHCEVAQGLPHYRPTVTLSADSEDLIRIYTGELDGAKAFMGGRIQVAGDTTLAMKIMGMFKA